MPKFTVEVTYYVPVYRHVVVDVPDANDAPQAAIDALCSEDATNATPAREDYESLSADFVTGIWEGGEAYSGNQHEVPAEWCRDYRLANE